MALRTSGRCGDFVDHLPPLVMERDAGPGLTTASVGVCIRNAGKAEGRITIGIEHVQEHDVACSPDEAPVDASCGGGQPGEIGSSLRQVVDVDRDCKARVPTETDVAFLDLGSSPLVISESLRPKKTTCVELRLRYVADGAAAVRAQSDTIRWEYVIALTSN